MDTLWLQKKPGEPAMVEAEDGTCAALLGLPDRVRLPEVMGGQEARVISASRAPCPMCESEGTQGSYVVHLRLEGRSGVAECRRHGFVWYREAKP